MDSSGMSQGSMTGRCEPGIYQTDTESVEFLTNVFHALNRLTFHYINHAGTDIHIQAVLD